MTAEDNKAIVRRFYQAFEKDDLDLLKDVLAPDLVAYNPHAQNRDEHIQGVRGWNAIFSDNHFEVTDQIVEEDMVVTRVTLRSTHSKAPFQGIPPVGTQIEIPAVTIERIHDGKIVARWVYSDRPGMIKQLRNTQWKDLVRCFIAASAGDDLNAFVELLAPDFVAHLDSGPANRDVFVLHNNFFRMAFSDRQFTVDDLITEGDLVMARATWRGTHSGVFLGLAPTGKQIAINVFITDRIQDGKIVEHWSLFDQLSMMQQLGLVPPPPARS